MSYTRSSTIFTAVTWPTAHCAPWAGALLVLKYLVVAERELGITRLSVALLETLVLGKVVLILEHVPPVRGTNNAVMATGAISCVLEHHSLSPWNCELPLRRNRGDQRETYQAPSYSENA